MRRLLLFIFSLSILVSLTSSALAATPVQPTSLKDVQKKSQGISYWSWKKASQKIVQNQPKLGNITTQIGARTVPDTQRTSEAVNLVSRLYANFEQPSELVVIYANYLDTEWGQSKIDQFCGRDCGYDTSSEAKNMCRSDQDCFGAFAARNQRTGAALMYQTASDEGKRQPQRVAATVEAHEYLHTIQDIAMKNSSYEQVPRWFVEGGANWVQAAAVYSASFSKYRNERNRIAAELFGSKMYTPKYLEEFLNPKSGFSWKSWEKYEFWRIYDIGMLATEVMTSIGGPDSFMNVFAEVGQGRSFEEAFESEYAMSWKQGVKVISRVLANNLKR